MGHQIAWLAALSQICLLAGMLGCYVLWPEVLQSAGGISNYGAAWPTIVPYTLGFGLSATYVGLAARAIPLAAESGETAKLLQRLLYLQAMATAALLISTYPYQTSQTLDTVHRLAGTVYVGIQLVVVVWLVGRWASNWVNYLLLIVVAGGAILMFVALATPARLLAAGQVTYGLAYGILFVRVMTRAGPD